MSEESYEDLVKQLKPLSICVERMSDQQFKKHKRIDDPNLIRDEKPIANHNEDDISDQIEVFVDIPLENGVNDDNDETSDTCKYSCFFCKQQLCGYQKAFSHFQLHIDYFPIQCSICDEANTDTNSFIAHCHKMHPSFTKASYHHKLNKPSEKWIETYLKSQSLQTYANSPHAYCPACDWIHLNPDVNSQNGDSSAKKNPQEILCHIHDHICYVPFNCAKCKDEGNEYCLSVLDHRVRKHLLLSHGESYEPPGWKYFNKKYAIPSLDKFIANYLSIFGIKIAKKRNIRKPKENKIVSNVTNQMTSVNHIISPANATTAVLLPQQSIINQTIQSAINGYKPIQPLQNQLYLRILSPDNSNGGINKPKIPMPMSWQPRVGDRLELTSPLLLYPSNPKLGMTLPHVESTDLGIICVDPKMQVLEDKKFKYICVFCTEREVTFNTKMEACLHYSQHVNYYPIVCVLCESKFNELSELMKHYDETHENYKNNIFHYIKEDMNIETWIDEFLDFQKTYDFKAQISATYGDFCVVCKKLAPFSEGMKMQLSSDNTKLIRTHIYQHLSYFPYQCTVCHHGDRRVRFSSLNLSATEHLKHWHQTKSFSHSEFTNFFAKCGEIVSIEKYIDNDIFGVRENTALNQVTVKRKLETIVEQTKEMNAKKVTLSSLLNSPVKKTYSKIVVNNNDSRNLKSLLASKSLVTPDNGIKAPLKPNSISTPLNSSINLKTAELASVNKKLNYCERFLQCFHCHEIVNNTIELESHHQNKHPKLSIASYTPNRDDIRKILSSKNVANVITIID